MSMIHVYTCRCTDVNTRVAAYDLVVELCTGCYENFAMVAKQLITMHHKANPQIAKEWEVSGCGQNGREILAFFLSFFFF